MKQKLEFIYYRFYTFQFTIGRGTIAEFSSLLHITLILLFHVFSIGAFIYAAWGVQWCDIDGVWLLCFLVVPTVFNYFLFTYKGKYKLIYKRYKNEPEAELKKGNRLIRVYTLATFVLFLIGVFLMVARNNGMFTSNQVAPY